MIKKREKSDQLKRVGIWIRVSTEDQARGESPEHHEKRARFYADSKGWKVIEVYHLEAVSGKSVWDHPETQRMLGDLRNGRITGLIFSKLARLARNTRELLDFADVFEQTSADLISLQEAIDTSTPAGRLFYTLLAAFAQWEREEIAERVAASVPIRAKLGKPTGGAAPFGYRWENRKLVPDPAEAPVRRLIYELYRQHGRKKTVARLLNEAGHRTRNGSRFSDTTVDRLIADPTAKGIRRANYTRSLGTGKQWKLKPESDWVLTEVDAIVPEELWQECNDKLENGKNGRRRPAKRPTYLFTGFVVCECGNKMYVPSWSTKYNCTKCHNKIPTDDLEAIFAEQLRGFFFSETEIAKYLETADQDLSHRVEALAQLEKEHAKIRREMDKVYKLYLADKITPDGFAERYNPLEERAKALADQIPELQAGIDYLKTQFLSSSEIVSEAQDLYSRWSQLDEADKRAIIETITDRVVIGKTEVSIELFYLPSGKPANRQHNNTGSWPRPA